jgi:hypothetical protein
MLILIWSNNRVNKVNKNDTFDRRQQPRLKLCVNAFSCMQVSFCWIVCVLTFENSCAQELPSCMFFCCWIARALKFHTVSVVHRLMSVITSLPAKAFRNYLFSLVSKWLGRSTNLSFSWRLHPKPNDTTFVQCIATRWSFQKQLKFEKCSSAILQNHTSLTLAQLD